MLTLALVVTVFEIPVNCKLLEKISLLKLVFLYMAVTYMYVFVCMLTWHTFTPIDHTHSCSRTSLSVKVVCYHTYRRSCWFEKVRVQSLNPALPLLCKVNLTQTVLLLQMLPWLLSTAPKSPVKTKPVPKTTTPKSPAKKSPAKKAPAKKTASKAKVIIFYIDQPTGCVFWLGWFLVYLLLVMFWLKMLVVFC